MTRSRIAIFEGYGRASGSRSYGRPSQRYGAPLFQNPRVSRYGAREYEELPPHVGQYGRGELPPGMGRSAYYVPPLYRRSKYGPVTEGGRRAKALKRKGYKVKKGRNTKWQAKFKKIAKSCARQARGKRKGSYQSCMKKRLKRAR